MTVYPLAIDSDETIVRIDDNLSELGTEAINQLRSAVFAIEEELGIQPSGSLSSVANRLDVSINPNGTIKASALTSVGLATLPIDDAQVGSGAGIQESKLALDYSTADLNAQLTSNTATLNSLAAFATTTDTNLLLHISGAVLLSDGSTAGRHVASHIDINDNPLDARDPTFVWNGLVDKDGNVRSATTVAEALLQINDEFVAHQLDQAGGAHFATGISVDTTNFFTLPKSADTVQKSLDAIDDAATIVIQQHQANHHSNGVPRESRTNVIGNVDGYSYNVVPQTPASAFLVKSPSTNPVDNNTTGDDIISFAPTDNSSFLFDEQFSKVKIGDVIRVNYGNGVEGVFNVESKRHLQGSEWVVRINGTNLANADGYSAFARIDRRPFENNKFGVMAAAAANNDIDPSIPPSLILGNPRAANALGLGFDPTQLDSSHYNLYLAMYPTGNPADAVVELPVIDVTGDAGISAGSYTIDTVVQTVNDAFRAGGFNYRFIAYSQDGEFGVMMSDTVSDVSFSIISGTVSAGSLTEGVYTNNVIGDATDGKDPLGLGVTKSGAASPNYTGSFDSALSATSFPTVIFPPLEKRNYTANGISRDDFAPTYATTTGGYWDGYISDRTAVGTTTVEITYQVEGNLARAELKPGKTILVQPEVDRADALFNEVDYGRFIIKSVVFQECCATDPAVTFITVINGLHASGAPTGSTGIPDLPVRLYFGEDSVSFNTSNVIDAVNGNDYSRYHEAYVNEEGETFSHERARMPIQTETVSLLNTDGTFKIREVSPKLKGYLDDASTDLNRFVRFVVLSYDSTSGEFDGYLGRRTGVDNVTDFGRIVTARKNVPARFYDASDVDFIEIEYVESDQYPGSSIISTDAARYVDIEIFDTLATNQENFLLAGCTVVNNRVECITDLREFGNVSEIDFTDSAIKFIEAGERHLHDNGVVAGFTYKGEDASNPGTLSFNGGIALVNGHFSTLGAQLISIPEIVQDTGAGETTTLNWGICVNDQDLLEAIPVTPTKQHFFARRLSDTDNYYIPSVTFDELTNNRKDLTLLYIANVTIASVTVNSVTDARANILNSTRNIPMTISDDVENSLFTSFEQVVTWASNSDKRVTVHVNGDITVDEEVDLTAITNLTVKGDGGRIIVNSENGFLINSGVRFEGVEFIYNNTLTGFDANDNAHLSLGIACINMNIASNNIVIDDCVFDQETAGERAPYVALYNEGPNFETIDNIKITNNHFKESDNGLNCAVGFLHTQNTTSLGARLSDINIDNNKIDGGGSIVIASTDTGVKFLPFGVSISGNYIDGGVIGYSLESQTSAATAPSPDTGITIADNYCYAIMHGGQDGKFLNGSGGITGSEKILNNTCNAIVVFVSGGTLEHCLISGNTVFADEFSADYGLDVTSYAGIFTFGGSSGVIITNNYIHKQVFLAAATERFDYGILAVNGGTVTDNVLDESFSITGITCTGTVVVTGNKISRDAIDITSFIDVQGSQGICRDNVLNSRFIDVAATDTGVIESSGDDMVITSNINQTVNINVKADLYGHMGPPSIATTLNDRGIYHYHEPGAIWPTFADRINLIGASNINAFVTFDGANELTQATWTIPFQTVVPVGAKIIGISATALVNNFNDWDRADVRLVVLGESLGTAVLINQDVQSFVSSAVNSLSMDITNDGGWSEFRVRGNESLMLKCVVENNSGTPSSVTFEDFLVTYTF